jgi:Glycosyltransferases involved in cell wall biogenesis
VSQMSRFRAFIPPIAEGTPRPQWTVLIPTYNCAKYLETALASVLDQDPGIAEMEIIVVDDCSNADDPEEVVRRIGGSRVQFIRQAENVGKIRNFETGLLASRGYLIHQLHGDDRVRPGFYRTMSEAFDAFPTAGAFFCECYYISEDGQITGRTGLEQKETGLLQGWLEKIVVSQRIQTPSIVVRRLVYETVGGFDRRLDMVEDWEMWIRIASRFAVGFVAAPLAEYRSSSTSTTASALRSGRVASDIKSLMRIVDTYLSADFIAPLRRPRNQEAAQFLTQLIPRLVAQKNYRAVWRSYREVLSLSVRPTTVYRLLYFTYHHDRFTKSPGQMLPAVAPVNP